MIRTLQKILLTLVLAGLTSMAFSQGTVKGVVVDASNNERLIGASVIIKGTTIGVVTNAMGMFNMTVPSGKNTVMVQFVGFTTKEVEIDIKDPVAVDLGTIKIEADQIGITEVTVFASVAVSRKTPVAQSRIEPIQIEEKLGTQEFPEILKSTPGVYATKQGGGFGDSRINLRGFASENIAVMINGVPMNDMEWGGIYWSNWAGLADVTRIMQVQRGLGASKVAAPSLGGSINIVTNSTDAKKGGAVSYGIGNDGYNKVSFAVSTGLTENNWAVTLLGAKTTGNGYIQGTEFESYSYFVNVSKRLSDNHHLSFTAFGAPQWHNQRNNADKLLISEWQKQPLKYRYNASYGFNMNGQQDASSHNVYHKPQISLNHFWTINEKSNLSTAAYVSIGEGYGLSGQGANRNNWYGSSNGRPNTLYRNLDGSFDYGGIYEDNVANNNLSGSLMVMSKSVNQHRWYGLLSTYTSKLTDEIDFFAGVDLRYYKGVHTNEITNLYGGSYFIDPTTRPMLTDQSFRTQKLNVGDVVYRDYDGYVLNEGLFMQVEYNKDELSTFISLSGSNTTYWRDDRFYYDKADAVSEKISFLGYSAKGGANYNLTDQHQVFANIGVISRAPFFSGGAFLQSTTSNITNPNAVNEKAFSMELGYGFVSTYFSANLNLYRTLWMDKTMIRSVNANSPESRVANLEGVNALHQGIELDFVSKPLKGLEITGMISLGDWIWQNDVEGYVYDRNGNPMTATDQIATGIGAPDHQKMEVKIGGIKVGNSAQTSAALGARYELLKGLRVSVDGNYYGRNYSYYNISSVGTSFSDVAFSQPWMIPDAVIFDLGLSYRFKLGGLDASVFGNIYNLLDSEYISDATDGTPSPGNPEWTAATVFYGFGRTYSTTLKIKF